jgi:thiamine monophosphate synthase
VTLLRDKKWSSIPGFIGGLTLFAIEALIVAGLGLVAWVLAIVILALI